MKKKGLVAVEFKRSSPIEVFKRVFGNFNMEICIGDIDDNMRKKFSQDPPMETEIPCTLEQLYTGVTKIFENTRSIYHEDGTRIDQEKRRFRIKIEAGWKKGTKIKFLYEGDVHPGRLPADQIFVINELAHAYYAREGHNLVKTVTVNLKNALRGLKLNLPFLDGSTKHIQIPYVYPDYKHEVDGLGMPKAKSTGHGKLIIKFHILFPDILVEEQRRLISKTFADKEVVWRPPQDNPV